MRRLVCVILALCIVLSGCAVKSEMKKYTATYLTLFDTVTTIVGFAESEETFTEMAQKIHEDLLVYHQLFDVYNDYEGINNLKTINDHAGIAPVQVDEKIIALLQDCKSYYDLTAGKVNVAMGSVLKLWHEARNDGIDDPANAYLPDAQKLAEAAEHADPGCIIIDEEASTVYLSDPDMRLDVGAVAKGWAAEAVANAAPEGLLISVGGNVCATGPKDADGTPWVVGIQNPDGGDYLHTIYVSSGSVVTSGDYQRAYAVDGKVYHHIIDPATRYPSAYWRSVTVVCEDSAMADALSTALFVLSLEDGKNLLETSGAEAMWVDANSNVFYSNNFQAMIRT